MIVFVAYSNQYSTFDFLNLAYRYLYKQSICQDDILENEYGKPFFKKSNSPSFNLSHSGEYIVCTFGDKDIGIDIQKIRPVPKNIINKYLKYCGKKQIKLIEEWTKYESYGKKMGIGIPFYGDYANGHFLTTFDIKGYVITVCVDNENEKSLELVYL